MFIKLKSSGYDNHGSQRASGLFLILFSPPRDDADYPPKSIRACVRSVRMSQFGHWMMSSDRYAGHRITLSGAYGADGLTRDCPDREMWDQLTPITPELYDAWNNGGGWNSAGSEAPMMRRWALENLANLRRPIRASKTTIHN